MTTSKVFPTILCGGSGTRLWPLSRALTPKQFLPLVHDDSMLQDTLTRLPENIGEPIFICNEEHRFLLAEQLRQVGREASSILLEPQGRNTAPAVALAALHAIEKEPDAILLVLAADHVIEDKQAFHHAISKASEAAKKDKLVTFGILPTKPETGYGYIKYDQMSAGNFSEVIEFVEKPDFDTAKEYVSSGDYLWNSGMFLFKASRFLEELDKYHPSILVQVKKAIEGMESDLDFLRPEKEAFLQCDNESIDYAVMEKTDSAVVVPLDAGWNDVGSYSSLWEVCDKDSNDNVIKGDVIAKHTNGCLIHGQKKLIATLGVSDLVIVDTPDAVLVANKHQVQDVKLIVEQLKRENRSEANLQREVYRPWGKYDSIDIGERFQVKRITVKPGAKLSVQMHHHRAEHWIIVSGTAKVTIGENTKLLSENQSTYIPIGEVHALENPGKLPLEMIEVQSGSYLGEDDIVRFEDRYGRS